jgi:hypothetical protein
MKRKIQLKMKKCKKLPKKRLCKFFKYFKIIGMDYNVRCLVYGDPELKNQDYLLEEI